MDRELDLLAVPAPDNVSGAHESARKRTISPDCLNDASTTLSPQQSAAIVLLLKGVPLGQVAKTVEVHPGTLYRWRHEDPDFIAELSRRRAALWDECVDQMRGLLRPAINVLSQEVTARYDRMRFRAATAILRLANVRSVIPVQKDQR